jgi:cadmium resistance protein CadD (predicted permease)
VLGQYLGFTALILISLVGFFGGRLLSHEWIPLLGVIPIAVGIKKLLPTNERDSARRGLGPWNVATVTFANGGDNIGVYTPLFAVSDAWQLAGLLAVFRVLIAVWCFVGALIPRHPLMARILRRGQKWIASVVLIALGAYILAK